VFYVKVFHGQRELKQGSGGGAPVGPGAEPLVRGPRDEDPWSQKPV